MSIEKLLGIRKISPSAVGQVNGEGPTNVEIKYTDSKTKRMLPAIDPPLQTA